MAQVVGKGLMQEITPGLVKKVLAEPKTRLKLVMLLLAAIASYFLWVPALDYFTPIGDDSASIQDQAQALRLRFIVMYGFSAALSILFAYGFFRMALRFRRKSRQLLSPGMSAPLSTVVKSGREAHIIYVLFAGHGGDWSSFSRFRRLEFERDVGRSVHNEVIREQVRQPHHRLPKKGIAIASSLVIAAACSKSRRA